MNKTIVVKVGTSTLTNGTPHLHKPNIVELVRQLSALQGLGHRVLLVSSGAVAAGRDHLGHPKLPNFLPVKQMLSAVGQGQLMQLYSELFGLYSVRVGQVLVTGDDLQRSRARYLNTRDTLQTLLDYQIMPIINENDTVAVDEIKVGDNDNLSAMIASLINADLLLILTDSQGLFDKDPRQHSDAQLIPLVAQLTPDLWQVAGGSVTGLGIGGMQTKLQAAETAGRSGIETVITHGKTPNAILRVIQGEALGTRFAASAPRIESRKRWLLTDALAGQLVVDAGAAKALLKGDASLLPVGVTHVEGEFERGELVQVVDKDGKALARGQTSYPSDELRRLCGVKSAKIAEILGYSYGDAAVHHDNMVLL
jgi:glutamate 5-kinase